MKLREQQYKVSQEEIDRRVKEVEKRVKENRGKVLGDLIAPMYNIPDDFFENTPPK